MSYVQYSRPSRTLAAFALAIAIAFAMNCGFATQALAASKGNASAETSLASANHELSAAAAGKNLKKVGMKFDLKNGKKRYTYMKLRGYGNVKYSVTMSKYKVKSAGNGRKKATFKMIWKLEDKVTDTMARKVHKALARQDYSWDYMESGCYMLFLDYVTGRNLEDGAYSNGFRIEKKKLLKDVPTKNYYDSDGAWFYLGKAWTMAVTVSFPADYKNLCVGVGYGKKLSYYIYGTDWLFLDEYASGRTFYQTSFCKQCKDNFHFKRIK